MNLKLIQIMVSELLKNNNQKTKPMKKLLNQP
jgi:hypothetical protein